MKPKIIKSSQLIKIRGQVKKSFYRKWGFGLNSKTHIKHGGNETAGQDSFDDGFKANVEINLLNRLIGLAKELE